MNKLVKRIKKSTFGYKLFYLVKGVFFKLKWHVNKPEYPKLKGNKRYIHLGCGRVNHPDFINVDLALYPHIHHLSSVEKLPMFPNNFVDLTYVSHCLEHIPHPKIIFVLKEWLRVLKVGGVLRISVPDFEIMVEIYQETKKDLTEIQGPLMGGQDSKWNIHGVVLDENYLTKLLKIAGFRNIRKWEHGSNEYTTFPDWSGKYVEINSKKYPISLNIEAEK
jgi:predicted SAM-dependent methyltransferase